MTSEELDQLALTLGSEVFGVVGAEWDAAFIDFARCYRAALAKKMVGVFRHKESGELRYTLDNRHSDAEWEDVCLIPMEGWK